MGSITKKNMEKVMKSIWNENLKMPQFNELAGDLHTEVCIIGGGLCGLLTAKKLVDRGINAIVLEANRIGSGQTSGTTGKITLQHGYIFDKLLTNLGTERAKAYFHKNAQAVKDFEKMVKDNMIDCDFEKKSNYVYSINDEEKMIDEATAAKKLGIDAHFVKNIDVPFKVAGAVEVKDQAQYNVIKFLRSISKELEIYENSRVLKVEGNTAFTQKGSVRAEKVIFACHYPFVNFPGWYFGMMYCSMSYEIAFEGARHIEGMYIDEDKNGLSLRQYKNFLILCAGNHNTGKPGGKYADVLKYAYVMFPKAKEVIRWSAQYCMTPDSSPYIGLYSKKTPDWLVATGFNKWGMSSSMVAANILVDIICGVKDEEAEVFSAKRKSLKDVSRFLKNGAEAARGIAKHALTLPKEQISSVKKGEGKIVSHEGEKIGIYNDGDTLYAVTVRCPHMGCELTWNAAEKSWDCPCHGSRFSYDGSIIDDPAQTSIENDIS